MNKNTLKMSLRTLIVLLVVTLVAQGVAAQDAATEDSNDCLLYTSPSPRDS